MISTFRKPVHQLKAQDQAFVSKTAEINQQQHPWQEFKLLKKLPREVKNLELSLAGLRGSE